MLGKEFMKRKKTNTVVARNREELTDSHRLPIAFIAPPATICHRYRREREFEKMLAILGYE